MKDEKISFYRYSLLTDHVIDYCKPDILDKDLNVILKIHDYYAHQSLNENIGLVWQASWLYLYFI